MTRRFGRLPPLTSLEGFEAAARLKSFSLAADELNITQSAVSHQIRALEAFFGIDLFNRVGRSVELTVAGEDFLDCTTKALATIAQGKRRINFFDRPGSVVWGASSAFASKWLLPRYTKLKQRIPDIQPWLFTHEDTYELDAQDVDLAIWYGDGDWAGVSATKLFHDHLSPLYSQTTLSKNYIPKKPKDLLNCPLLHDERTDDWLSWFHTMGIEAESVVDGPVFSDPSLLLDSAMYGQGIALGSLFLAHDLIERGLLHQPFKKTIESEQAYYLVHTERQNLRPSVAAAKEWLLEEVASMSALI